MQLNQQVRLTYRLLAALLCFVLSPLPQFAQSNSRAGQVSALRTSVQRNSSATKAQDAVNWNDLLKTDNNGRVRVGLDDGSILSVGTSSQMRVVRHDAKSQQTQIELTYGKMRSQVVKLVAPGSSFEVRTPTAVAGVIGTDFILDVSSTSTKLYVLEGTVTLTPIVAGAAAANQAVKVNAGETAEVAGEALSGPSPTPNGVAETATAQTVVEGSSAATGAATAAAAGSGAGKTALIWGLVIAGAITGATVGIAKAASNSPAPPPPPPQRPPNNGLQIP
jgi:hypothetical protein